MAAKKSKTTRKPKKAASRRAASTKPRKAAKPATKKKAAPRKIAKKPKKGPIKKAPPKKSTKKPSSPKRVSVPSPVAPRSPKTFAERIRDFDAGTGVWFTVAGGIEHAVMQKPGDDGAAVIRTDAGTTEVVSSGNLFETAEEARAARYR